MSEEVKETDGKPFVILMTEDGDVHIREDIAREKAIYIIGFAKNFLEYEMNKELSK